MIQIEAYDAKAEVKETKSKMMLEYAMILENYLKLDDYLGKLIDFASLNVSFITLIYQILYVVSTSNTFFKLTMRPHRESKS